MNLNPRYGVPVEISYEQLLRLRDMIEHSYSTFRNTGKGYAALSEWQYVNRLIKEAETAAVSLTLGLTP